MGTVVSLDLVRARAVYDRASALLAASARLLNQYRALAQKLEAARA